MAIIKCSECGKEISDKAKKCPKCGHPVKNRLKVVVIIVLLFILVLVSIISVITIKNKLLGVEQLVNTVEVGTKVDYGEVVKLNNDKAVLTIDDSNVDISKTGKYYLKCIVQYGNFSMNHNFLIHVVDTTVPKISGQSVVVVPKFEKIKWSDYYTVEDYDEGLEESITTDEEIDTNNEVSKTITLKATDKSGNIGTLDIKLKVMDLSQEEKIFVKVVNKYLAEHNKKLYVESSYGMVYKTVGATNGVSYYVYLTDSNIYAIYSDGSIKEYTATQAGGSTTYTLFKYALLTDGEMVGAEIVQ
ncbi:MAG: zinc-ribbon domain-containing protein [Lachnospiraceae bacterium]|nr:zinc-ribbon domain-containing protein [Lachnospiraceae bacterium]